MLSTISSYFAFAISKSFCLSPVSRLLTRPRKIPLGIWSNLYGISYSFKYPFSITRILSESMTVCKRCAIVSTVKSLNFSLIVFCIKLSVC